MLMPSLANSRSVIETIQEVKVVQIWESMVRYCEMRGRELLDADVITSADLYEWLQAKNNDEATIISVGLPCYSFLQALLNSIKANSGGLLLLDGVEVTYFNRPKEKLLDWFFNPVMVLKEQIRVIRLGEDEVRFLEKAVLFGSNTQRMEAWQNGSLAPQDALRAAQIQGISRRMIGMIRSVSKFPTYRRRFRQVVKDLITYTLEEEHCSRSTSLRSVVSV
ncbi:hypothetical protein CMV_001838 [Castanea mollissima]|nr:hypothetical protein CMV_001838 [Castanea mollissima]